MSDTRRRKMILTLRRRRDYLAARIAVSESRDEPRDLTYDKGEMAALEFALGVMEDATVVGLTRLGQLTLSERDRLRRLLEAERVGL